MLRTGQGLYRFGYQGKGSAQVVADIGEEHELRLHGLVEAAVEVLQLVALSLKLFIAFASSLRFAFSILEERKSTNRKAKRLTISNMDTIRIAVCALYFDE